jgi:hypothetical protein
MNKAEYQRQLRAFHRERERRQKGFAAPRKAATKLCDSCHLALGKIIYIHKRKKFHRGCHPAYREMNDGA